MCERERAREFRRHAEFIGATADRRFIHHAEIVPSPPEGAVGTGLFGGPIVATRRSIRCPAAGFGIDLNFNDNNPAVGCTGPARCFVRRPAFASFAIFSVASVWSGEERHRSVTKSRLKVLRHPLNSRHPGQKGQSRPANSQRGPFGWPLSARPRACGGDALRPPSGTRRRRATVDQARTLGARPNP